MTVVVPEALAASHAKIFGAEGRAWTARLPGLATGGLDRWDLRIDGPPRHGVVALVLPVRRADGTPAALKLQPVNDDHVGEPVALRAWAGRGAVLLLEHDPATGSMLLERLDGGRSLDDVPDDLAALRVLTGLLARLAAVPPPPGLRRLGDVAAGMLADVPRLVPLLAGAGDRSLAGACASAVRDLLPEPGDRLLHWDLHYENVLAGHREPWLAIDPQPLVGDVCFELMPALDNRWPDVVATGDVTRAVRRRFDLMVEALGLDPARAAGWTLARALQNVLWDIDDGELRISPVQAAVARAVLPLYR